MYSADCSFFNRDVNCIRRFFRKRFRFEGQSWPVWNDVLEEEKAFGTEIVTAKPKGEASSESEEESEEEETSEEEESEDEVEATIEDVKEAKDESKEDKAEDGEDKPTRVRLDLLVEASGFGRKMQRELEDVSNASSLELTEVHDPGGGHACLGPLRRRGRGRGERGREFRRGGGGGTQEG